MSEQIDRQHKQFAIYAAEAMIPRYQRAWVWGVVALAILLSGVAAGWLLSGVVSGLRYGIQPNKPSLTVGGATLIRQQAVNEHLRIRIVRLEQALSSDACGPEALEALTQGRRP
ncbi:MAG: hypothetical protein P9E24_11145 [Candidatus Competibacter sp.]|nr:hypothetical protein [Candidatus Competibacter sp.]MDG4582640.1 hypothetical protein [Candidatus Competibacter sp.]